MEEATLARELVNVPAGLFQYCQRLTRVNLRECPRLVTVDTNAFMGCWALPTIEPADICRRLWVSGSGIRSLRLPREAECYACWRPFLETLLVPRGFSGSLRMRGAIGLRRVTTHSCEPFVPVYPTAPSDDPEPMALREVRYTGARWNPLRMIDTAVADALARAETASVCRRPALPLPPP
jgi:hypothetical protein